MSKVLFSCFDGLYSTSPYNIDLDSMLNLVTNNYLVSQKTQLYRQMLAEGKKVAADQVKRRMPCISVSVVFEGGKTESNVASWTSIGMVDLDHVPQERMQEVLQLVRKDPYTLVCFTTISGQGIRIFYRYNGLTDDFEVNKKVHEVVFKQVNRHYEKLTGCPFDSKCKNINRQSVLAHDPDCFYNPQATVCDYATLRTKADEQQKNEKKKRKNNRKFKAIVQASQDILEKRGVKYEPHHHDEYISQMGLLMNEFGADETQAVEWAAKQFADYKNADKILQSCFKHTESFNTRMLVSPSQKSGPGIPELKAFLSSKALFRKNTINNLIEVSYNLQEPQWQEMMERDVCTFWTEIREQLGFCNIGDIRLLLESNFVPLYNPFLEYFQACGPWDGKVDYLEELSAMVHTRNEQEQKFFQHFFKKWFVGMVASLIDPEVVNNQILLLIGPQGIYKTSWLNKLLPPSLSRYFCLKCDSHNLSKDDRISLAEFAIICLEELDNVEGSMMSQIKSMTTLPRVTERAPYARYKEVRPHIASLAGTSNYHLILNDLEGNRRWLPIDVLTIDNPYETEFNYQGIYAQAYFMAQNKKNFVLTQHEIAQVNEHNHDFEMPCPERDLIQTYFRVPLPHEPAKFVTNAEIMIILNSGYRMALSAVKVGIEMKKLGFKRIKVGGIRGYRVIILDAERIELNRSSRAKDSEPPADNEEEVHG